MAVQVLQYRQSVSAHDQHAFEREPGFLDHCRDRAARAIAETALRDCSVYRRIDPPKDDPAGETVHMWSIGLERDTDAIKLMEAQIKAEAGKIAERVADEAIRQIEHWGSHYGRRDIEKDQAARFIRAAVLSALGQP